MLAATQTPRNRSTASTACSKDFNAALLKAELALVAGPTKESLSNALGPIGISQDEAAFAMVYGHFAGRVKSFLIGKGLDEDTAEELMQEIMLTVWRRAESYDPAKAAASTWIFTIA